MKAHIKSTLSRVATGALAGLAVVLGANPAMASNTTEFRYQILDEQTVKVGFWNNSYFTKNRAQEVVFEKIARLAMQQGVTYFELQQAQVSTDYVATGNAPEGASQGEVVKTMISRPPVSREWSNNGTIVFPRYFFTTQVKFYKAPPAESASKVYNARSVVARQQYLEKPFKSVKNPDQQLQAVNEPAAAESGNGAQSTGSVEVSDKVAEWTDKSYQHLQKQEWLDAIRTASAAINLNKDFDVPYVNRATAYIRHGYPDKAATDVDTALALNPNNALAINIKGYLHQEKGAKEEAMRQYRKACNQKLEIGCSNFKELAGFRPDDSKEQANFYLEQSAMAMEKNRWNEVIEWTTKAIEADPENYKAYANRSGALAEAGRPQEAILDADQAIALNPDFAAAYHNRGHAYKVLGDARDAALEFEIACGLGLKESCTEFTNLNSVAKK